MVNLRPFSDSFAKILPSLVQKECTLPARVPLVSSWTMPCLYRVLCDEEFFNFLLDWYTEFFIFQFSILHIILIFRLLFGFLMGWDLEISSSASSMLRWSLQIPMIMWSVLMSVRSPAGTGQSFSRIALDQWLCPQDCRYGFEDLHWIFQPLKIVETVNLILSTVFGLYQSDL